MDSKISKMKSKSPLFLFVSLYRKKLIANADTRKDFQEIKREAVRAWKSLSKKEQQIFIDKFHKLQEQYNTNIGKYLEKAKPFMKRRTSKRDIQNESQELKIEEDPVVHMADHEPTPPRIPTPVSVNQIRSEELKDDEDLVVHTANHESTPPRTQMSSPIESQDSDNVGYNQTPISESQTATRATTKPMPPAIQTGKELFEMVSGAMEAGSWSSLTATKKRIYQAAALMIRQEYIRKYKEYLESLSSEELFKHYNETMEYEI